MSAQGGSARRLRFAMVTTFYPPYHFGGDAHVVRALTHALARRGHTVDVIHDVDAFRLLHSGAEPEPEAQPEGVTVHALSSRLGALSALATQQTGRPVMHGRTIRRILARGFDVIHYHNVSLVGGPGVLSYGQGIKLYTTHEHWLVCPTHVLWRHQRELCTGRECVRCVLRHGRPPQVWRSTGLLEKQVANVDLFLAPSRFTVDKHREFGFEANMEVLPNFLADGDTVAPSDAPTTAGPDVPFFLFVGRLEHIKGLHEVIPLFGQDSPAELWIAGRGSEEPRLRELAHARPAVRFLGWQSPAQLRDLYRRARAVVLPSICYETFGMVALEAFREGTPVIARDLGAFPELVHQSQAGVLFRTREELAGHLQRLARDEAFRNTLGRAGRQAFERHWTEQVVVERYLELVASLARSRQ